MELVAAGLAVLGAISLTTFSFFIVGAILLMYRSTDE